MKNYILAFLLVLPLSIKAQKKIGKDIGIWKIQKGEIIPNNNSNDEIAFTYWNYIINTLPEKPINQYVYSFRLYTDGESGDLGGITQMDDSNAKWRIELDIQDFNLTSKNENKIIDYQHTIIHEFGHLITLNVTQISPSDDKFQDDSKGYLTSEGYAIHNSYLDLFIKSFWQDELLFEWDDIDQIRNKRKRENKLIDFYLEHEDAFVTDYAAESPEEDIAESWTYYVLDDITSRDFVKKEKVMFFEQFEELQKYRLEIREKLKLLPNNYLDSFKLDERY